LADPPWRIRGGEVLLAVRLTPKSSRDGIEGPGQSADGATYLKVRVRAVPQDGEANEALIRLVAKSLRLPSSSVRIDAGGASRIKTLVLSGDPIAISEALARLCEA
jgi:uncharacterized protein YggU (UPF0235/DUF167 family)